MIPELVCYKIPGVIYLLFDLSSNRHSAGVANVDSPFDEKVLEMYKLTLLSLTLAGYLLDKTASCP